MTRLPPPKPYPYKHVKKLIAVADYETDPFKKRRVPEPFTIGFYDGHVFHHFWGADCTSQFVAFLASEKEAGNEYVIYMHNGGRFDFLYLMSHIGFDQTPMIINGRIVKCIFAGQEFRDSWALFPQALSSYQKDEIDYDKFEAEVREKHREEIVKYMRGDCVYTFDIVQPFLELFGDVLTVGSVALKRLNSFYGFETLDERDDAALRPFYFGGRVQCFEVGDFHFPGMLVDANSMYPAAMKNSKHPVCGFHNGKRISARTGFALIDATSRGCLPWREPDGRLGFPHRTGEFYATAHEIEAGRELGLLDVHDVKRTYDFDHWTDFSAFVDEGFARRFEAKEAGDKAREAIWKRVNNSGYGKFALDPRRFSEYHVAEDYIGMDVSEGWEPSAEGEGFRIWQRPTIGRLGRFLNVATAASITGSARANLMRNLSRAERPLYCDTDSIICADFHGDIHPSRLGAWDVEARFDRATIAAKKIYALWSDGAVIKKASKGARLSAEEIVQVANGEIVEWENEAPNFSFAHEPKFVKRKIKRGDVSFEAEETEMEDA